MSVALISVHVPKTAGSSLLRSLEKGMGRKAVLRDVADDPGNPCSPYNLDPAGREARARRLVSIHPEVKAIHGHFNPSKYAWLTGPARVAFLRHPVENLMSVYAFWRTLRKSHCLWKYFRDNALTVVELAALPTYQHLFSRTYFGGVDLDSFDFVGFADRYSEDLQALSRLISVPLVESQENVLRSRKMIREREALRADAATMHRLHQLLADDIRFYDRARDRWEARNVRV